MYDKPFHNATLGNSSFLVTGGAGFIGSHLVEYLLKYGAGKVVVLDNLSTGTEDNIRNFSSNPSLHFVRADICDLPSCMETFSDIDYVFHEAALGSVPRSIRDPLATNQNNINGFLNVLMAAKERAVKRVVYASSSSVFGDSPALPKAEHQIGAPLSPYAVTKRVNELYAHVFSQVYRMEIVGLRYFNIFGPRQSPGGPYAAAIPLFIMAMINRQSPGINGDGEQSRDFTFVENAVQANIRAMFCPAEKVSGQVFNIAVGNRITINELFRILKEISGSDCTASYREERQGDVKHSLADISRALQVLGYKPEILARQGLEITYRWFTENFQTFDSDKKP